MTYRGLESGMDFEYHNKTGPMDGRSPFAQLGQHNGRNMQTPSKRRPYDSPSKHSSPTKALPPNPAMGSLFNTPRKMNYEMEDSSAGETPKSPEHQNRDDSDATPDTLGLRSAMSRLDAASRPISSGADRARKSPTKTKEMERENEAERPSPTRRESWIVRSMRKWSSPGRGEVPRGVDHVKGRETRVRKRRSRELHRHVARRRRHSMSDSGDDTLDLEVDVRRSPRKTSGSTQANQTLDGPPRDHWISRTFTFIAQHPTVPHILSFYAQLLFNIFLLAGCAYLLYCFWTAVQRDIDRGAQELMVDVLAEIAVCTKEFKANGCESATRAPALAAVCENWARCMQRDPHHVGRARVSAHTFAEIFNSFVEPISWKAMIFTFLLVFASFGATNFAFGFFRDKTAAHQYQAPPAYYPPPTPQRSFSGPDGMNTGGGGYYGTPFHHQPQYPLEPQPSGQYGQIEGRGSPVRRIMYN